jgi:hypothetical protein
MIIALGSVTFASGPLPPPFDRDARLAGFSAGYVCDVVGVFGTYFDIDGCRPAAIRGAAFDDASKPVVAAIEARYPGPAISCWAAQGWKLVATGAVVLALGSIAWWLVTRTSQRAVRRRRTQFHLSTIDLSVATNHAAAWEHPPLPESSPKQPTASPWQPTASPWQPTPSPWQPTPSPPSYPAHRPAQTCHGYGPYGRVPAAATTPGQRTDPRPFETSAAADDFSKTRQDPSYQAYVEREHAIQLARGSQPEELEQTRRRLVMPASAVHRHEPAAVKRDEPAAVNRRLRHPPVPRPAQLAILSHIPDRLS